MGREQIEAAISEFVLTNPITGLSEREYQYLMHFSVYFNQSLIVKAKELAAKSDRAVSMGHLVKGRSISKKSVRIVVGMAVSHPLRLFTAWDASVLNHHVLKQPEEAKKLARAALDDALAELRTGIAEESHKDWCEAYMCMQQQIYNKIDSYVREK